MLSNYSKLQFTDFSKVFDLFTKTYNAGNQILKQFGFFFQQSNITLFFSSLQASLTAATGLVKKFGMDGKSYNSNEKKQQQQYYIHNVVAI